MCGCSSEDAIARQSIQGQVTLDQTPVTDAVIVLTPVDSNGPAAAAVVENGKFAFGTKDGPGVGRYFVRINPNQPEIEKLRQQKSVSSSSKQPSIPLIYQTNGELQIEIQSDQSQPIRIQLVSRS